MIGLGILLYFALVIVVIRRIRPFGRKPLKVVAKIAILLAVLYPVIESLVVGVLVSIIASPLAGTYLYKAHGPVEGILMIGARKTCDMQCLWLLQDGYREVELQLEDMPLETSAGPVSGYFVTRPGLYSFRLLPKSDPRCADYLAWAAALPKLASSDAFEPDVSADRKHFDDGTCVIAERRDSIHSAVAVRDNVLFRDTYLGQLREYRYSIYDLRGGEDSAMIAESRSILVKPDWPVSGLLSRFGAGYWGESGGSLFSIKEVVPPL
jgi:hypothetical protein